MADFNVVKGEGSDFTVVTPDKLRDAIEEYFQQTPPEEVVQRAEELKPPPESEPLGMLSAGVDICKDWTTGMWRWKKKIRVYAQQVEMPEEYRGMAATAKVTIYVDDKVAHTADIPWAMPRGSAALALQVYMLAKQPNYAHPEWQPTMEQFAFKCNGFAPPAKMYWSKEPLLD